MVFSENKPHRMPEFIATSTALALGGGLLAASTAGKIVAGGQQARALDKAGGAELTARQKALEQQIQERQRIETRASEAAKPSLREIEATDRLIADNDRNINQAFSAVQNEIRTLEEATDPAIRAAGENLTNLIKGKSAEALGPVTKQRQRQRKELENQLRARLGSGFRTSTAGIQSLQGFDDQTDLVLSETQNRAISTLSQSFGTLAGARRAGVSGATGLVGTAAGARSAEVQAEQNIAQRRLAASTAGLGSQVNFGQVADAAAAPFAGDIARAQTLGQVASDVGQVGGQLLGAGFGGGGSQKPGGSSFGSVVSQFSTGTTGGGGQRRVRTAGVR